MALNERTQTLLLGALGDQPAVDDLITNINEQGQGDIKKDGSVDFQADQSMGGHKLVDVDTPTNGTDSANKNYVDAVIPSQSGNSGKFLTTNGSSTSWGTAGGGGLTLPLVGLNNVTENYWNAPGGFIGIDTDQDQTNHTIVFGSTDTNSAGSSGNRVSDVIIQTGAQLNSTNTNWGSGELDIVTGSVLAAGQSSGNMIIKTGISAGGGSGNLDINTGSAASGFSAGSIVIAVAPGGFSNSVSIQGGDATDSTNPGGDVTLLSGSPGAGGVRGKIKLQNGSEGTAGQVWTSTDTAGSGHWAASVAAPPNSTIYVTGGSGYGSSGTKVRAFTTQQTVVGSDVTYTSDATNGDYFTINTTGVYTITYCDTNSSIGGTLLGMSLNATTGECATDVNSLAASKILFMGSSSQGIASIGTPATIAVPLTATDVIRAHGSSSIGPLGNITGVTCSFRITRVA